MSMKNASFMVGERVFLCMPAMKTGAHRKLSCPFKGPYRVTALHPNGAEIRLVGKPRTESIRVALNRLRRCPTEIEGNPLPSRRSHSREPRSQSARTETPWSRRAHPETPLSRGTQLTTPSSRHQPGAPGSDCGRSKMRPGRCREPIWRTSIHIVIDFLYTVC